MDATLLSPESFPGVDALAPDNVDQSVLAPSQDEQGPAPDTKPNDGMLEPCGEATAVLAGLDAPEVGEGILLVHHSHTFCCIAVA